MKTDCIQSSENYQNYFHFCILFYVEHKFLDLKGIFSSNLILLKKKWKAQT